MDGRANRGLRQPSLPRRLSPFFPSDLHALGKGSGERLRLAGRVLAQDGVGLRLGDAFAMVGVEGALPALSPGDWALLSGVWDGRVFARAKLLTRSSAPLPRGDGELARLSFNGVGERLRARARALAAIRAYFAEEAFLEVETPFVVPAPGVDSHIEAVEAGSGFLITSPELAMKRLLVGAVPRMYQLARVARRDEVGILHEPEFTLLEWYRAFAGQEAMLRDTENLVRRVAKAVSGRLELVTPDARRIDVKRKFERVSVAAAFREHAGVRDVSDLAATDESRYFELLVERVEPALSRAPHPVFLTDYPLSQAALARPSPADPRFAERFELYVGGIELSNGYAELTDPVEQRRRFVAEQERRKRERRGVYPLDERFLASLVEGMPDAGGNALGFDRLILLATGAARVQDVIAFPRERL